MGSHSTRRRGALVVVLAAVAALATAVPALAQLLPGGESTTTTTTTTTSPVTDVTLDTTTTTAPPSQSSTTTTSTTAPPPEPSPAPGPAPAPAPAPVTGPFAPQPPPPQPTDPGEGEAGADATLPGRVVPPDAQAIINSIPRTAPNNNTALVEGAALLEAAGVSRADAVRAVFGRFPIHGPTRWSDDWYFPRWTGTQFRFHQGLDMFAEYGTPVAAPVDGVARVVENALGGLTVHIVEPDRTYWYLAHLAGIAPGLVDGQPVTTGQVVGYVGDSGNARGGAPHLHFGIYPQGAGAVPPKPVVDAWVADGAARVPELLASISDAAAPAVDTARRAAGADVGPGETVGPSQGELLWASAASPSGGALHVAEAAAAAAANRVYWNRRAAEQRALDLAWARSADRARRIFGPLTNSILRQTVEQLGGVR